MVATQMSTVPIPVLEAFIETTLCIYGIVLSRHHKAHDIVETAAPERARRPPMAGA